VAKKTKKQVRKTSSPLNPVLVRVESQRAAEKEFNPDYSAVIKDLKRIGILAGTF
jgi:hypothetical protein